MYSNNCLFFFAFVLIVSFPFLFLFVIYVDANLVNNRHSKQIKKIVKLEPFLFLSHTHYHTVIYAKR